MVIYRLKTIYSISIFLLLTFVLTVPIFAQSESEITVYPLETSPLSEEYISERTKKLQLETISASTDDFTKYNIVAFDVSDDEFIAVGLENYVILIFDKNMNIQTAFSFKNIEDIYYLNWNGNCIDLIFYRSYISFSIDMNGSIVQTVMYDSWSAAPTDYMREITHRTTVDVGNTTYQIQKTTWTMKYLGGEKYDLLMRVTENNPEEVLFSSQSKTPKMNVALVLIFLVGFVGFTITLLVSFIVYRIIAKKLRRQGKVLYPDKKD